jgi:hypothetical protein
MRFVVWFKTRTGMEQLALVWMVVLTVFTLNLISLHDRASGKLLRIPPGTDVGTKNKEVARPLKHIAPLVPLRAQAKIVLLVLFFGRKDYLEATMESVLRVIPRDNFAIVMSQVLKKRDEFLFFEKT